jgi:hypothetical protein
MGTILQELGHDIVLMHFINGVLEQKRNDLFYIVSPATGPKIDIHYWDSKRREFTSAFNVSGNQFVPQFALRMDLGSDAIQRLTKESRYESLDWYQQISKKLGRDLKDFVLESCDSIQEQSIEQPDIIGVDTAGQETVWAEIKVEGIGRHARQTVSAQSLMAHEKGTPFYLVLPRKPVYGSEVSGSWIQNNLPANTTVYTYSTNGAMIIPKRNEIQFSEFN